MCIFLFSLNFECNLEDYTWDCKCILMQAWLHLQVPKDVPMYTGSGGTGGLQVRCWYGTLITVPQNPRSEKCHLQGAFTAHKIHLAHE